MVKASGWWCFLQAFLVFAGGCSAAAGGPKPTPKPSVRPLTIAETQVVQAGNSFGFKLFQDLDRRAGAESVFFSPLSVSMALGMTLNGAAGTTAEAMTGTLGFAGIGQPAINDSYRGLIDLLGGLDPSVAFQLGNSIWYRPELAVRQEFVTTNQRYFDAEVRALDFSDPNAGPTINGWVSQRTSGKIPEIVPQVLPGDAVMYLINAIYFKGAWSNKFDKTATRDDTFTLADSTQVPCKMMHLKADFAYTETGQFQAVDLPYGQADYSMTIVLPKAPETTATLVGQLDPTRWQEWLQGLRKREIDLFLPRFRLAYEQQLNAPLTALGMGVAFRPEEADFSRMADTGAARLYISEVKHKSVVDVDEEGTEAAAATSVEVGLTSAPLQTPVMRLDRPFVFFIREQRSGTVLFMGKVGRV